MSIQDLPNDPIILLSFINTKLSDFYPSLDAFCEDSGYSKSEIISKLKSVDYEYNESLNKFV